MVLLLNGSFGVGKTTVARLLRQSVAGSAICDPEAVGYVLRRLPAWVPLRGRGTGDYQDMPAWRAWTLAGIRATRLLHRIVIVPMAFSDPTSLAEIRHGIQRFDPQIRHFCLIAPLAEVEARLSKRGVDASTAEGAWAFRRASEFTADPSLANISPPAAVLRKQSRQRSFLASLQTDPPPASRLRLTGSPNQPRVTHADGFRPLFLTNQNSPLL